MFNRAKAYMDITRGVLSEYALMQKQLALLPERIATERARLTAIRSALAEGQAVHGGGGNVRQERDTAILSECDRLEQKLKLIRKDVSCIENALVCLTEQERRTLELMDIQRQAGAVDRLCEELFCERSNVYKIHNDALDKFSLLYNGAKCD